MKFMIFSVIDNANVARIFLRTWRVKKWEWDREPWPCISLVSSGSGIHIHLIAFNLSGSSNIAWWYYFISKGILLISRLLVRVVLFIWSNKNQHCLLTDFFHLDKLALRAGNEKDSDEQADTVGCCSLR